MASCDHLCSTEEQMRDLLAVVNDHLKLHDTDEEAYGSLLAVAYHLNEALHESVHERGHGRDSRG